MPNPNYLNNSLEQPNSEMDMRELVIKKIRSLLAESPTNVTTMDELERLDNQSLLGILQIVAVYHASITHPV